MIKVSVMTTTYRDMGGITMIMEALKRQEFPHDEFEYVIVDDHYEDHHEEVAAWDTNYDVRHIPPRSTELHAAGMAAVNSGLAWCRGEIVFSTADYVQPLISSLLRHWELYKKYGPDVMISGPLLPWECTECAIKNQRQFSLPDEVFQIPCNSCGQSMIIMRARNMENGIPYTSEGYIEARGLMRQTWFVGRNDSFSLEAALAINGMDERLDGYANAGDSEMGMRLMNYGCRYIIDRLVPVVMHPHVRGKTENPKKLRKAESVEPEWDPGVAAGTVTYADHGWDIRSERDKNLQGVST